MAAVGAGLTGTTGAAGRCIWIIGTLTTGKRGLLDLMVSSAGWPCGTSKPSGKVSLAVKERPGSPSLIWTSTFLALTDGSDSASALVPLFWMVIEGVSLVVNGGAGNVICGGETVMAAWTLAKAVTVMTGMFEEELFKVICP